MADTAIIANFDIEVTLDSGRKGKGTTLFAIQPKTADPCAVTGLVFPGIRLPETEQRQRLNHLRGGLDR